MRLGEETDLIHRVPVCPELKEDFDAGKPAPFSSEMERGASALW